jgi:hypothetical protein
MIFNDWNIGRQFGEWFELNFPSVGAQKNQIERFN